MINSLKAMIMPLLVMLMAFPSTLNAVQINLADINMQWGESKMSVKQSQSGGYTLQKDDGEYLLFYKVFSDGVVKLSYKFDEYGRLTCSAITLKDNFPNLMLIEDLCANVVDGDIMDLENMTVCVGEQEITGIYYSNDKGVDNTISAVFSYYDTNGAGTEDRDDCVDLGLSVRWATCNLGASAPQLVGDPYAWSEIKTRDQFWIDTYQFSNNNKNQYVFEYTNPLTNICGTQYDAATSKLGDGWRLPDLTEATELIEKCKWEKVSVEGQSCFKVTGPNGNSIILPMVGFNKQNKGFSTNDFCIATGECATKSSDSCFVISMKRQGSKWSMEIGSEWKCWGYSIRPVYTK